MVADQLRVAGGAAATHEECKMLQLQLESAAKSTAAATTAATAAAAMAAAATAAAEATRQHQAFQLQLDRSVAISSAAAATAATDISQHQHQHHQNKQQITALEIRCQQLSDEVSQLTAKEKQLKGQTGLIFAAALLFAGALFAQQRHSQGQ
jgi:hypothetical protein